jgi:hypothetical protein
MSVWLGITSESLVMLMSQMFFLTLRLIFLQKYIYHHNIIFQNAILFSKKYSHLKSKTAHNRIPFKGHHTLYPLYLNLLKMLFIVFLLFWYAWVGSGQAIRLQPGELGRPVL